MSEYQLSNPELLTSLTTYYQAFEKFLKIIIFLEDLINNSSNFDDITNKILRKFCKEKWTEFSDFDELLCKIGEMKIKINNKKIPKLTLQMIGYIYSRIMQFPVSDFSVETFTSNKFFENVYYFINVKIHLHYSHVR